jgi:hypothetical protein
MGRLDGTVTISSLAGWPKTTWLEPLPGRLCEIPMASATLIRSSMRQSLGLFRILPSIFAAVLMIVLISNMISSIKRKNVIFQVLALISIRSG